MFPYAQDKGEMGEEEAAVVEVAMVLEKEERVEI